MKIRIATLDALRALEASSVVSLEELGQSVISFDIADWSIGKSFEKIGPGSELDAETISQLSRNMHQLDHIIRLSKALSTSASQLLELHQRKLKQVFLKLSRGLESLPDELLAAIFGFAILHEQNGTRDALRLSHVSRRFRQICLEDHHMWTTICLRPSFRKEWVETVLSRSGMESDLRIVFNTSFTDFFRGFDQDFTKIWSRSFSRWRSLALMTDCQGDEECPIRIGGDLGGLMREPGLKFPRLEELFLGHDQWPIEFNEKPIKEKPFWMQDWMDTSAKDFTDICPWDTPRLRTLRCVQYIPPPSFPFSSFTTISLSLKLLLKNISNQVEALLNFLPSQHSLSTFILALDSDPVEFCQPAKDIGDFDFRTVVVSTVTTFELKIIDFGILEDARIITKPLLGLLHMPNLEFLTLSIDLQTGWYAEILEDRNDDVYIVEMDNLVPDPRDHLHLTSFTVNMPVPREDGRQSLPENVSLILEISLDSLPHVTTLTVTTFARIKFSLPRYLRPESSAAIMIPLTDIHFCSCENLNIKYLRETVQSLKETGVWKTVERVFIRDCRLLVYSSVLKLIGKKKLRFEV